MSKVTASYERSDKWIQEHLIETGISLPQYAAVEFDFERDFTPAQRKTWIDFSGLNSANQPLGVSLKTYTADTYYNGTKYLPQVKSIAARLDAAPTLLEVMSQIEAMHAERLLATNESIASADARNAEADAERAQKKAEIDERIRAQVAKDLAERNAMIAWAAEHGSEYLKEALAQNYDCKKAYWKERRQFEYPGSRWENDDEDDFDKAFAPSLAALKIAKELRAKHPNATIGIVINKAFGEDDNGRYAIKIDDPLFDEFAYIDVDAE